MTVLEGIQKVIQIKTDLSSQTVHYSSFLQLVSLHRLVSYVFADCDQTQHMCHLVDAFIQSSSQCHEFICTVFYCKQTLNMLSEVIGLFYRSILNLLFI